VSILRADRAPSANRHAGERTAQKNAYASFAEADWAETCRRKPTNDEPVQNEIVAGLCEAGLLALAGVTDPSYKF
jgi:hypothetical protein